MRLPESEPVKVDGTRHVAPVSLFIQSPRGVQSTVMHVAYCPGFKFIPMLTPWYERIERHEKDPSTDN